MTLTTQNPLKINSVTICMQDTQLSPSNMEVKPPATNMPQAQPTDVDTLVTKERQAVYGHPADDFTRIANMMSALGFRFMSSNGQLNDVQPEHIPSMMILVKLSRMSHNPNNYHADSLLDIKGYAKTAEMVYEKLYA